MATKQKSLALILEKEDWGEADQIFFAFTKNFGKLEILAKGIRKINSKLRAGMELFYLSEIEFIEGKTQKILTDAILIDKFENLRKDFKRLKIAFGISEVLNNLVRGEEADEKIWQILIEVFEKLNNFPAKNLALLYYYFCWNLVSILGYQPELYFCLNCQKRLKLEKIYFNPKEGGLICQNCFQKFENFNFPIRPESIKILRKIIDRDWQILLKLKIKNLDWKNLKQISKNNLLFLTEKK